MTHVERRAVAFLCLLFGGGYAAIGMLRHWRFATNAFDLGIFDQAVWHLSRFEAPASSILGYANILGDHFYPAIAVFAPLYWVAPRAETLIAAQAVLLAASIIPVFLFARDRLPSGIAVAFAGAYGCYWGLQKTAEFDVHEMAFAPLAIAWAIRLMDRRRWPAFWMVTLSFALIKEDLIPVIGSLGLLLILKREWRRGITAIVLSIVGFLLVLRVVIPSLNGVGDYVYIGAFQHALTHPWLMPLILVTPIAKVWTALLWFAPFAFLSFLSPIITVVAPLIPERLLSDNPAHWGTTFHYSAPFAPIVAMAAADGLAKLVRRWSLSGRSVVLATAGVVLLASILPGHLPLWQLLDPPTYRLVVNKASTRAALSLIPAQASVVAQSSIAPHLSQRQFIYMLDAHAPDADFVVTNVTLSAWPAASYETIRLLLEARMMAGYERIFDEDGWTVLRRSTAFGQARP